jgi:predicted Zn-dependent protease
MLHDKEAHMPRWIKTHHRRRVAGTALGLLAVLAAVAACSVNPATGERQLTLISERQEIALGQQSDEEIVTSLGLYPDDGLQRYVGELGRRLAERSERPELDWTFRVVDDPVVNAFALPGGFIYITRGILAHLNNEAELAGVLGHEIGHVTARHSVEQLSRAQLAQIGLGVGMIASERFREVGDLAQTGLGVLFLKFGRDDERQADDLGLRYLDRAGYDPREMIGVFEVLQRVSRKQEGGRVPGWLSTHPAPENRIGRMTEEVRGLSYDTASVVVGRERYLEHLDGLVFGDDPREGFFDGNVFYHPALAFQLRFPEGWKTRNQKQSVSAASPEQDAVITLTLARGGSADAAAREFFDQEGVSIGSSLRLGLDAPSVAGTFRASTDQGDLLGVAAFVEHGDAVFRLLGYAPEDRFRTHERTLETAVGSFREVRDRRILEVEPRRLDLVELPRTMTLSEVASRYPSTADLETLMLINGVSSPDEPLAGGRLVKRVVGGELPGR